MFRRLSPLIIVFLAFLADTAVMPVFYYDIYTVPLTLSVVLCVGLCLGKLQGMLMGMIGGLFCDITAGTLGVMTFYCLIAGFMVALILNEHSISTPVLGGFWLHLRRWLVIASIYLLGEIVFNIYRYFLTASFEWFLVSHLLIRTLLFATITILLMPPLSRLFLGKPSERSRIGRTREVKRF
ncbi:MAG: hypothetical protein U0L09_08635 [Christensenellales bacterium]|nr:hypothetical protein [Christensenellales bacterium]